jgi:hypothetical protein
MAENRDVPAAAMSDAPSATLRIRSTRNTDAPVMRVVIEAPEGKH